uniref:Uncharacterized protein n=1 Tax=Lotus japonicus TaxID=34305 RepID=I3T9V4_LOTJA|nr:unknown [Lotus japonicus]
MSKRKGTRGTSDLQQTSLYLHLAEAVKEYVNESFYWLAIWQLHSSKAGLHFRTSSSCLYSINRSSRFSKVLPNVPLKRLTLDGSMAKKIVKTSWFFISCTR